MKPAIRLRQEHLDAMVQHALEEAPLECCGLLAACEGMVATVYRARNKEASPFRFSIDGLEQRRLEEAIDQSGAALAGFYHSHTGSEARPSPTDIHMMSAFFGPPYVHFVVGVPWRVVTRAGLRAHYTTVLSPRTLCGKAAAERDTPNSHQKRLCSRCGAWRAKRTVVRVFYIQDGGASEQEYEVVAH